MGEVVNLRLARKRKQRAEAADDAARNRAVHGRSKAEKQLSRQVTERQRLDLDGHRLLTPPSTNGE